MLRPYSESDFSQIYHLNNTLHKLPTPEYRLHEVILSGGCPTWVWEDDDTHKVVGFLISSIDRQLPYVYNICVDKSHSKRGIGTTLLTAFIDHFKDSSVTWLQVDANNPAQKLYFDLGFRVEEAIKELYGPDTCGLDMYRYGNKI